MKGCLDRKETQGETRESTEEKETRQGKRSELNLKLNLREMRDGRGYLQKTTDMSLLLVNHISSGFTVCSPRRREVCFHAMIDKLDAFLCYYLFLLLIFSHRVLSSYPNFSVIFTPGELIRVWCQGLRSLCGVHRSPDWLNSRPLRWLSCHRRLHHFSRSLHFSEGLDVADLSQDGKFASVFPTGNAPHRRSIGCPVATRRSSN